VEALAVKLTQSEGELIQEKFEVKKLVNFLKQVLFEISSFSIEICFFSPWNGNPIPCLFYRLLKMLKSWLIKRSLLLVPKSRVLEQWC
jgi:hypothetical protein